jgi:imidazolonepropionase-like amidohydrolase
VRTSFLSSTAFFFALFASCAGKDAVPRTGPVRAEKPGAPLIALVGATVVHPESGRVEKGATVLITGSRITAVAPEGQLAPPPGSTIVDAHGQWLVPGYIDTHIHFFQSGTDFARPDSVDFTKYRPYREEVALTRKRLHRTLATWLATGVTSVADVGGPFWNFDVRSEARTLPAAPDVYVTGPLISPIAAPELAVAGDPPILKVKTEADVDELVAREVARKPDYLKFWYVGDDTTDAATTERLMAHTAQVAHAHGLRLAVHAEPLGRAKAALRVGADMLVHSVSDRKIDDEFISLARAAHATYTPTLFVAFSYDLAFLNRWRPTPEEVRLCDPDILKELRVLDGLTPDQYPEAIKEEMKDPPTTALSPIMADNLVRMWREGFVVTVGTDAGNIGVVHGPSYYRELNLMAEAGLTPAEVLRAATTNGAKFLKRETDVGEIRPGMLADLVLLRSDPLADVRNLSAVVRVLKDGKVFTPTELIRLE